jgi:hypothetical protein
MSYGKPDLLFFKYDILSTMEGHRQKASQLVHQMNGNALLNTPTEDIVAWHKFNSKSQFFTGIKLTWISAKPKCKSTTTSLVATTVCGKFGERWLNSACPSQGTRIFSLFGRLRTIPALRVRLWKQTT